MSKWEYDRPIRPDENEYDQKRQAERMEEMLDVVFGERPNPPERECPECSLYKLHIDSNSGELTRIPIRGTGKESSWTKTVPEVEGHYPVIFYDGTKTTVMAEPNGHGIDISGYYGDRHFYEHGDYHEIDIEWWGPRVEFPPAPEGE